jgi:hypothetical protein
VGGERRRALGQRRRVDGGEGAPAGPVLRLGAGEVVAEGGADRRLVARRHLEGVEQRRALRRLALDQRAEGLALAPERRGLALGRRRGGADGIEGGRRLPRRVLGRLEPGLRLRGALGRLLGRRGGGIAGRVGRRALVREGRQAALGVGQRPPGLGEPRLRLALRACCGVVAPGKARGLGGGGIGLGLGGGVGGAARTLGLLGLGETVGLARARLGQRGAFALENGEGLGGVGIERRLSGLVLCETLQRALEFGHPRLGPRRLRRQPLALEPLALQDGRRDRLLLAERGQRLGRGLPGSGRAACLPLRTGEVGDGGRERRGGGPVVGSGVVPEPEAVERLGTAQRLGKLAVPPRLPRLAGEARDLGLERVDHVGDPREVRLGGAQLELGLVAAGVEAGDAGRLLEHSATRLRLRVDQLGDLALADQRRRMGAARRVGEEELDVTGASLAAVDAVGRARRAGDPPGDVEVVRRVERRRRAAGAVVDPEADLGEGAGRAGRRAGEDHVLHAVAAHDRGPVLAHHPAQRLEQVRLAAAVRADDAGQPRLDHEFRGIDEALEADEAETGEVHGSQAPGQRLAATFPTKPASVND